MNGSGLRDRLGEGSTVVMPGVWDVLSAVLAAQAGFDAVFVSGFCVSATLLGRPDLGFVTQTEMADVARRICDGVRDGARDGARDVAVVVDADTGYGDSLNTIRTVELWEQAGAAGMFLEDQTWPKRCGHMASKQVVPAEEWLVKLGAAVEHRHHLHVTARTDARAVNGLDDAIERAKMARDVGVDALFIEAPESVAELERIAEELADVTLVANMVETGKTPLLTQDELAELGFRIVVSPLTGLFSMAKAVRDSLALLRRSGSLRDHLDRLVSFDDFGRIVGLP